MAPCPHNVTSLYKKRPLPRFCTSEPGRNHPSRCSFPGIGGQVGDITPHVARWWQGTDEAGRGPPPHPHALSSGRSWLPRAVCLCEAAATGVGFPSTRPSVNSSLIVGRHPPKEHRPPFYPGPAPETVTQRPHLSSGNGILPYSDRPSGQL